MILNSCNLLLICLIATRKMSLRASFASVESYFSPSKIPQALLYLKGYSFFWSQKKQKIFFLYVKENKKKFDTQKMFLYFVWCTMLHFCYVHSLHGDRWAVGGNVVVSASVGGSAASAVEMFLDLWRD